MFIPCKTLTLVLSLLSSDGTLHGVPARTVPSATVPQQMLMIRVSQESSPGAGDFDTHILGFIRALQTLGKASDFYEYEKGAPNANYGNAEPALTGSTCHVFFVNASDGLALFVVMNKSNDVEHSSSGDADTRFELFGGTASILMSDDYGETVTNDGKVFISQQDWQSDNTDGEVIGALPVGFTLLGQFTQQPRSLDGGWVVISADGARIPLDLVPGRRVRLDVALHVQVRQDH